MNEINTSNDVMNAINNLNLNQLKILVEIIEEKNLTRVGEKVGLSQSAISHALKHLRYFFNDELVIRNGNSLELTSKSEHMRTPLKKWFGELEQLCSVTDFTPSTSSRTFTIACMDLFEQMIAPSIIKKTQKISPLIKINFTKLNERKLYDQLISNEVDFVIGVNNMEQSTILHQNLYSENFASMVRQQHPLLSQKNKLNHFLRYPHVVTHVGDNKKSFIDIALQKQGLSRDSKFTVSNFSSAPYFVEDSDAIFTGPERFLKFCERKHKVSVFPTPLDTSNFMVKIFWAKKFNDDNANKWFRSLVSDVTAEI